MVTRLLRGESGESPVQSAQATPSEMEAAIHKARKIGWMMASQEQRAENVRLGSHERLNHRTFCCGNRHLESFTSLGPTGVSGTLAE